ncbi:DUF2917 domain-containing protein [Paraburkholderia sartisoli]|uniref:DUF2917 domain-containing protein n=1 Tax=Paraburkholderia sartisoli TaxID=83784 RepID=A0A1H4F5V3_9BURK|nr:DUF2917 domain-containing protein [Paraburkholderia sartisoli]SEA92188.1 Protein of unknown function [Paraburkholderia sartisoli]
MDESSQQRRALSRGTDDVQEQRRYVVQFAVAAGETVTVKIHHDAVVSSAGARLWVTRAGDTWDYWLKPGETLRLSRGERVWVTGDFDAHATTGARPDADVTLTMHLARRPRIRWKWAWQPVFALW